MTIFEMAKKYYPRLWNKKRIEALHDAGKLTDEEYAEILSADTEAEAAEILSADTEANV